MEGSTTPNSNCVILGTPGTDPLTIVGPFDTPEEAKVHAAEHVSNGRVAVADILVAPANCP